MKIFGPAAASRNSAVFGGSSFGFLLLLIAVAATSATQTAAIAFLPSLIEGGAVIPVAATHDFHIVSLSASFPLAALGLAPIWGWLADRMDYRVLLRIALLVLAATTLAFGSTDLATLYLLRILSGMASGAIIPLSLLAAGFRAESRVGRARLFTWLTSFVFLGDLAGPLLTQLSFPLLPSAPLFPLALALLLAGCLLSPSQLPKRSRSHAIPRRSNRDNNRKTATLLVITIIAGAALAALHIGLLVTGQGLSLDRKAIAFMLSLCGVGMLAAQIAQARLGWLVRRPVDLTRLMLLVLAIGLLASQNPRSILGLAGIAFLLGWSAASLRLVTSFWISNRSSRVSGARLGLQHAAASIGQAAAPIGLALAGVGQQWVITFTLAAAALIVALSLPLLWQEGERTSDRSSQP